MKPNLPGSWGMKWPMPPDRHSTQQMTKAYGLQVLLSVVLGENPALLAQMAADLAAGVASLAFSRDDEYESDEYSVKYLYETSYDARGVAGFFEKMDRSPQPPEFLSTHPNPETGSKRSMRSGRVWAVKKGKSIRRDISSLKIVTINQFKVQSSKFKVKLMFRTESNYL